VLLACVVGVFFFGCEDDSEFMGPGNPQMAKGGKPGKPGGGGSYSLIEYFVYEAGGTDYVHVVGEGNVEEVNLNAVQDYVFDGSRDNGVHYEYTNFMPYPVAVTPDGTGVFHVDIPWNGETRYYDPDVGAEVDDYYRDFLIADIDGNGADPFAFDVRYQKAAGDYLDYYRPQGVILGGVDTHEPYVSSHGSSYHTGSFPVYSYAKYTGGDAEGQVFLTNVTLDPASVSCNIVTIFEGKGKNRTKRELARVSGTATILTGSSTGEAPSAWIETHFVDVSDGTTVFSNGNSVDDGNPAGRLVDITLSGDFSVVPEGPIWVQLAVDYVYPTRGHSPYVYNPSQNMGIGFTTEWQGPATQPGDPWPVALAPEVPVEVTCR
jgi:hypothetical protein